ncbi:hypothetical protein H9651_00280 [Microbacterium sp. Sa4CUA7]|uniref:Uncharacterized protein n=1 Tax=Microbacterium pullorum TaxID=2762236 RepID=A0ABR8RYC9_9MICO|nr:hypothetical protein [Microbacterium pullorum]MBD7956074.1 hypothetical protein [Microbacterium pullorum]
MGNAASAARINAQAGAEVASRALGFETFEQITVRQAIRLRPAQLAESEALWRTPVTALGEGDVVYRLYGNGSAQIGRSWSTAGPWDFASTRAALGLPSVNAADNLAIATVDDLGGYSFSRHALPFNGMPGGAPEHLINGNDFGEMGLRLLDDVPWVVAN